MVARWLALASLVGAAGCLARPTGSDGEPWPPPGVDIERAVARDVDGDGDLDLALASVSTDPATRGIYLLLGGPDAGTRYHAFVPTPDPPRALDLLDVGGGADPELAVLTEVAGRGRVLLYPGTDVARFAAEPWTRDLADLAPIATRKRGVRLLDSDGDGRFNVAAWDENSLRLGEPDRFDAAAFFEMPVVQAFGANSGFFTTIQDVVAVPGAGRADLVVLVFHSVQIFRGDGSDAYPDTARTDLDLATNQQNAVTTADLDGDGVFEIVGVQDGGFLGAVTLAGAPLAYPGPPFLGAHGNGEYRAARLLDLDRDPSGRLDLVVMEHHGDAGPLDRTDLALLGNLRVDGTNLTAVTPVVAHHPLAGLATVSEAGDFDGDGRPELLVGTRSGVLTLLDRSAF